MTGTENPQDALKVQSSLLSPKGPTFLSKSVKQRRGRDSNPNLPVKIRQYMLGESSKLSRLPTNPSQGGVKFYTIQQYSSYVIFAQQWEAFD